MAVRFAAKQGSPEEVKAFTKLCAEADSLQEVITKGINRCNRIRLMPGACDETNRNGVLIYYYGKQGIIGESWFFEEEVFKLFPTLKPVELALDSPDSEAWFEQYYKPFNASWSDALMQQTVKLRNAVQIAMSYAICEGGTADLQGIEQIEYYLDEMEPEDREVIEPKRACCLDFSYRETEKRAKAEGRTILNGWSESIWIFLGEDQA